MSRNPNDARTADCGPDAVDCGDEPADSTRITIETMPPRGTCWFCNLPGHVTADCKEGLTPSYPGVQS
jgi:hypothetical protein